ncbi:MAG: hypothetical protein AAGK00_06000 [Pseudomonadota bacterium]
MTDARVLIECPSLRPVARVDWRAFLNAAWITPVVFAVSGLVFLFYGVFVTVAAVVLGLPAMLFVGLPMAYLAITRCRDREGRASLAAILGAGLLAHLITAPVMPGIYVLIYSGVTYGNAVGFYATWGLAAAPIQALIFGLLYRSIERAEPIGPDPETFS